MLYNTSTIILYSTCTEPQQLSPPPTSGFPQVEENIGTHRKTENSLAAGIRGWG